MRSYLDRLAENSPGGVVSLVPAGERRHDDPTVHATTNRAAHRRICSSTSRTMFAVSEGMTRFAIATTPSPLSINDISVAGTSMVMRPSAMRISSS